MHLPKPKGYCCWFKSGESSAYVLQGDAKNVAFPDDSVNIFLQIRLIMTLYPMLTYLTLCYVWLKRLVGRYQPELFSEYLTLKDQIVVNPYVPKMAGDSGQENYQQRMTDAFKKEESS